MRKLLIVSLFINFIGLSLAAVVLYQAGGVGKILDKLNGKHVIQKMQLRKSQFNSSPPNIGATIFLGDSITEFGEWSELFSNHLILNRGIASEGIKAVQQRIDEIARHKPNQVFLMIGINDLQFHNTQDVTNMYFDLIIEMKEKLPDTELIIQCILPINPDIFHSGVSNEDIDKVNSDLKEYCDKNDISYLDIASSFKNNQNKLKADFSIDGIHITGIAYNEWAKKLKPWLPNK